MVERNEVYKCEVCGNIVEVVNGSFGELYCCGQPMKKLEESTQDQGQEKHLPIVEQKEDKTLVKVGSVEHPMEDNHYIQWIELIVEDKVYRRYLKPGEKPEAEFDVNVNGKKFFARAYCNLHGLWKS